MTNYERIKAMSVEEMADMFDSCDSACKFCAYIGDGWGYVSFLEFVKNQKAEAIKEFAERLKSVLLGKYCINGAITETIIDNLVKEMAGDME